jgi:hypothetical protein
MTELQAHVIVMLNKLNTEWWGREHVPLETNRMAEYSARRVGEFQNSLTAWQRQPEEQLHDP